MPSEYVLTVTTNRAEAIYQTHSRIDFVIHLTRSGQAVTDVPVQYVLRKNLSSTLTEGQVDFTASPAVVSTNLPEPGFVDCTVTVTPPGESPISASVAAAVEPLAITPSMPTPDDFNTFWDNRLACLKAVPLDPKITATPTWDEQLECFDVRMSCVDEVPVSGYFARPRGAKASSLPAVLTVHGAGVRSASAAVAQLCAERNWLAMDLNAHGVTNGESEEYYAALAEHELADYRYRGGDDPVSNYFVNMFLRVRRALDFLADQPQWDGRVLTVHGHSQGGYQAIAGAALDSRVTAFAAGVAAGCDHTGHVVGRPDGWPRLADAATGDDRKRRIRTARYIDTVNLITRTKAEAFFSVGCIDATCNPVGIYAAYNNHAGPKHMIHCPAMGHGSPPEVDGAFTRSLMEHARRRANS